MEETRRKNLNKSILKSERLHKKLIEDVLLDLFCEIFVLGEDKINEYGEVVSGQWKSIGKFPCGLDYVKYGRITLARQKEDFTSTKYATLFLAEDIIVPLNSKVKVYIEDKVVNFEKTGIADRYNTHQEIPLEREEKG
jgi:hypothetical protein|nr:MAG TPA: hypothetical protein [Caudoviricetes sp.]